MTIHPPGLKYWPILDLARCPNCRRVELPHAFVDFEEQSSGRYARVHRCPGCATLLDQEQLERVPRDDYNHQSKESGWTPLKGRQI